MNKLNLKPLMCFVVITGIFFLSFISFMNFFNNQFADIYKQEEFDIIVENEFMMRGYHYINNQYVIPCYYSIDGNTNLCDVIQSGVRINMKNGSDTIVLNNRTKFLNDY